MKTMEKQSINNPTNGKGERLAMSIKEAAERLSVSASFMRLEIARGHLRPIRLGRRVLIGESEIGRYLAASMAVEAQPIRSRQR